MLTPIKAEAATDDYKDVPTEIQEAAEQYGQEYDICPELIMAICYKESRYTADITDPTGTCKGVMQIKESCHKDRMKRLGVTDLYDVEQNIHVGADYLAELFEEYEDVAIVLGTYHGESTAQTKISIYTRTILLFSASLEREHGK